MPHLREIAPDSERGLQDRACGFTRFTCSLRYSRDRKLPRIIHIRTDGRYEPLRGDHEYRVRSKPEIPCTRMTLLVVDGRSLLGDAKPSPPLRVSFAGSCTLRWIKRALIRARSGLSLFVFPLLFFLSLSLSLSLFLSVFQ